MAFTTWDTNVTSAILRWYWDRYVCFLPSRVRYQERDLCWAALSTGWIWLIQESFFSSWAVGAGVFLHYKKMIPTEAMKTFQRYPIIQATFAPNIYRQGLEEGNFRSFNFPKLRFFYTGGEPTSKDVFIKWKQRTGVELRNQYGLSELVCCYKYHYNTNLETINSFNNLGMKKIKERKDIQQFSIQMKNDPRSYDHNFCNCVKKPEKNSGLQRGLNPWPRDTGAML